MKKTMITIMLAAMFAASAGVLAVSAQDRVCPNGNENCQRYLADKTGYFAEDGTWICPNGNTPYLHSEHGGNGHHSGTRDGNGNRHFRR